MASSALDLLVDCARAIQDGNLKHADSLLELIWKLADHESDRRQSEVVRYFAEALVRRAYGLHPAAATFTLHLGPFLNYYWYNVNEIVEDAIINAAMGKKQLHLIFFDILDPEKLLFFLSELSRHYGDSISVRASVILPKISEKTIFVQTQRRHYNQLTETCEEGTVDLKIVYANSLGEVDASMLDFRRTKDEAVVIFYWFKLHQLLAETGAMERELLKLRHINPETVIIVESNADHNNSDFIKRIEDSFQYYCNAFDLFDENKNHYRREIHNIVGCEGRDRIVRHQTLAQWQSHLQSGGFLPFPLEPELSKHINAYRADVRIHVDNGSAVFTLKNRPYFFISAWKHTDSENHFNPTRNNFAEGFNASPLVENIVQPFLPEAFSLNQLAALVEIYDVLEEVCFTYELELAFTWACVNVHEVMSDSNKKRALSLRSTFCYVKYNERMFQSVIKAYEELQLLEGQAIAGKALQSSEDFHFEPSIPELKKPDYPLADDERILKLSNCAAVAICLQNRYTMDVDYVVEFFLPRYATKLETANSLALRIFNDLKNMKKRFVTVKVRGTKVGFHEEAISNIPHVTMPIRSPPPSLSAGHIMERQRLIEQGSGKQSSFEPLANNENEMVMVNIKNLPTSSVKRRKLRSDVWEEFTKEDKGEKVCAICAHCNKEFDGSSTKGTTHLRNHLERCKTRAAKVKDQQLTLLATRGNSKKESASEGNFSFDQDRSSMDVARMIIKHQLPLNIVDHDFFSILLKNLQPLFKLQSQEALSFDIVRVYKEEKHKLLEYFGKLSCRFNLTISLWAHDHEKTIYCCYAVQFIDDNWEFKKKILALKSLGNQFDKRIFYENFKNFLVDWNFDKRVCSLTMYNSSSCFEIVEEIRSWHCFEASHPSSTFYFSSDQCIRDFLCKDNSGENVEKSIDGAIRTSNTCLLDILNTYKRFSQQEGRGYPLMNVKSDNNWRTCSMVLAIAAVLDPRFRFHFLKFSFGTIYGNSAAKIHLTMIRETLTDIFNEYASSIDSESKSFFTDTNCSTLLNAEENTMESFHRWYNSERNVNTEVSKVSELDKYLHQSIIIPSNPEFDILGWWCEQASNFPILGRMVRDILAMPLSSVISGSTLNEKAMMDNPIFSGLDPQIIEAMICGKEWLESPKGISNVEPNKRSGNIDIPILRLEDSQALTHHSEIEHFLFESDTEEPGSDNLRRGATTWTEKDVRAYLVSPFTVEELEHLKKWQNRAISGEYIGQDKIQGKALAPLLKIPPPDVDLKDARNYYIEDTVVNQFFVLLKRRYERYPHKYQKHHSFDSFTATFLIDESKAESQVLSWVNQEDLKGVKKLFLPMCLHEHWLLFVADTDDKKLIWLDSNEHSRMSNVSQKHVILHWFLKFLLPLLGHDHKDWSFDVPKDIPMQKNSVDCALFVMKYADCLTHGNYFPFTQNDMAHFRHRTFLDLYQGSICLGRGQDCVREMGNMQEKFAATRCQLQVE